MSALSTPERLSIHPIDCFHAMSAYIIKERYGLGKHRKRISMDKACMKPIPVISLYRSPCVSLARVFTFTVWRRLQTLPRTLYHHISSE